MNAVPTEISAEQLKNIQGGHAGLGLVGLGIFILEIPHIFIGIREFSNYVAERYVDGCENIEENDYFTRFFCGV